MTTESSLGSFHFLIWFSPCFAHYLPIYCLRLEFVTSDVGCQKKDCGGLTLPGCQLPTKILYGSFPQQDRRGENKMEKTHGIRQRQFNKTKKRMHAEEKEHRRFYSLIPIS